MIEDQMLSIWFLMVSNHLQTFSANQISHELQPFVNFCNGEWNHEIILLWMYNLRTHPWGSPCQLTISLEWDDILPTFFIKLEEIELFSMAAVSRIIAIVVCTRWVLRWKISDDLTRLLEREWLQRAFDLQSVSLQVAVLFKIVWFGKYSIPIMEQTNTWLSNFFKLAKFSDRVFCGQTSFCFICPKGRNISSHLSPEKIRLKKSLVPGQTYVQGGEWCGDLFQQVSGRNRYEPGTWKNRCYTPVI